MSHPPLLAVAISGALALATVVHTYRAAHLPKPDGGATPTTATPSQQLDRALQALRVDASRDSTFPM